MNNYQKYTACLLICLVVSSCGTYFNQPFSKEPARIGELSKSTNILFNLPPAKDPVEVAVYNFSDQTGQYKAVESGSTFSTAVTQGATTILINALGDSGWFIPLERENFNNLSTERNIIRNTKQEYMKGLNPNEPPLPALLYAGLMLEGGIISYDTNIVTGGAGARYFGVGGSAKYRQDRITVYIRAVSTSSGEILKTIYVSKTILSQAVDVSLFRFVKFQRLLEAETGFTQNEPVQLAVKDAIEKAVHDLVIEGIIDKFWESQGGEEIDNQLVKEYLDEKKESENTLLYERFLEERKFTDNFSVIGGAGIIDGDYSTKQWNGFARLQYQKKIFPFLRAGINANVFQLKNKPHFSGTFASLDLNVQLDILPKDNLTPFVYAGSGMTMSISNGNDGTIFYKMQLGLGVEYHLTQQWGLMLFGEQNIMFDDEIDMLVQGKRKDYYYNFGFGINYYFNTKRGNVNKTLY